MATEASQSRLSSGTSPQHSIELELMDPDRQGLLSGYQEDTGANDQHPPHIRSPDASFEDYRNRSHDEHTHVNLQKGPLACLFSQHLSNTFGAGLFDFASFLLLTEIFPATLIPASLFGLFSTLAGLVFSGYIGGVIDNVQRLRMVRWLITSEKLLHGCAYAIFLILLGPLRDIASTSFTSPSNSFALVGVWSLLAVLVVAASLLNIAKTGLTVAFERDWVTSISQGDKDNLTMLNSWMRRIDLCSKLGAPLFVSLLTSTSGYVITTWILLAFSNLSWVLEVIWVQVVYDRFPVLAEKRKTADLQIPIFSDGGRRSSHRVAERLKDWARQEGSDWLEFSRLPIFCSSMSIAAIYLTALSYDGTFITYIKAARGMDDPFIAAMRGICVLTGLLGTLVMPRLESLIGLERAGAWSISFECACLVPVVMAFFYNPPSYGDSGSVWNSALLFGGIALSRIGLWSFDLCQLKELQLALDDHPRRNRFTALQVSLQNLFDLLKYVLTLGISSPRRFRYTALVSWIAVLSGVLSYAVYLRRVRGHLLHLEWFKKAC